MDRDPEGPQSMGSQRVRHDWVTNTFTFYWHYSEKNEFIFFCVCLFLENTKEYGPSHVDAIRTLPPNLIAACQSWNTGKPAFSLRGKLATFCLKLWITWLYGNWEFCNDKLYQKTVFASNPVLVMVTSGKTTTRKKQSPNVAIKNIEVVHWVI